MNIRACLVALALTLVSAPAFAQGGPGNNLGALLRELEATVSALRDRVARLESGQVAAADLVGRYSVQMLGVELGRNPYVATETSGGTMTLRADGTGEFTGGPDQGRCTLEQPVAGWAVNCNPLSDEGQVETFTWRYEDGNLVIVDEDGESATAVGAGGRVMVVTGTVNFQPGHSWSNVLIAVRLPD